MNKLRVGEEMSAALRFLESGDFLGAAAHCDMAASVCLNLGGYTFDIQRKALYRGNATEYHIECCAAKDILAELDDLLADVKPDGDSDASGTVIERVRALIEMAGL